MNNPELSRLFSQEAWDEVRNGGGEGFSGEGGDDGLTEEDWDWLLSLVGNGAGAPRL